MKRKWNTTPPAQSPGTLGVTIKNSNKTLDLTLKYEQMDTLTYTWEIRKVEKDGTHINKHQRKYIDFIVSGNKLSVTFKTKESDLISLLGWYRNIDEEKRLISEYLKQINPELQNGRTILYGCAECGDIGCGAITTEIIKTEKTIIWKNFAYENDSDFTDFENYKLIRQFEFDKQQYIDVFSKIESELAQIIRDID